MFKTTTALLPLLLAAVQATAENDPKPAQISRKGILQWVDTRIGTAGHGHTFMGVYGG